MVLVWLSLLNFKPDLLLLVCDVHRMVFCRLEFFL